ncbi:MAG TPA: sugar ABC transporter permease [Alphaproteobacteria bacterium]|nr:sugar ABC transporter permease [Alphaproteobacteria bacterium]
MSQTQPASLAPGGHAAAAAAAPARRAKRGDGLAALAFLAPYLVFYVLFLAYPFFYGIWISLHDWELVGAVRHFVGLLNYWDMFEDPLFWTAIGNTLLFAAMTVPVMVVVALGLALALNRQTRFHGALRVVFFTSSVFSVTVATLIWIMMLSPERGLIAHLFQSLGLRPIAFLGSPGWAMPALTVTTVWWAVGFPMILFLAGLQQIPQELYDAARIDNASPWRRLTRITLPSLKRTIVLVVVLQIIGQLQMFGQALIMTGGGPADRTRSMVQTIYETGFTEWQLGYASAMSLFLFAVMFAASMFQLYVSRRED